MVRTIRKSAESAWQRSYDDPLVVHKGDRVSMGEADDEWPDFRRCPGGDGKVAWLPVQILSFMPGQDDGEAEILRDYNPLEMTVAAGESVILGESLAGWVLCEKDDGEKGWLPERIFVPGGS